MGGIEIVVIVQCTYAIILSRKSRKTIDTTDTLKCFGPVEIHYGKVQQKVTLKYDSWHREILSRFGGLLGDNMKEFHNTVAKVCECVSVWNGLELAMMNLWCD